MEVHHHPHVEKKGFKEYLLEGLMIFIAVTMGFFAEGLREHIGDRNREKDYMQSLLSDLRSDAANLKGDSVSTAHQNKGLDTVIFALKQPLTIKKNRSFLYVMYLKYCKIYNAAVFSNGTIAELKNAGELRVIRNRKIVDIINQYEEIKELTTKNSDQLFKMTADIEHNQANPLLDFTTNAKIIDIAESGIRLPSTDSLMTIAEKDSLVLLKNDPALIASFRNNIKNLKSLNQLYLFFLENALLINENLTTTIKTEYDIE